MALDNTFLIGLGLLIVIYIMYKLFVGKVQVVSDYEKTYNKILTSDEYKVKSQYDK